MNCKPGDLAFVIRSSFGNEGRIVRVIAASPGNHIPLNARFIVDGAQWIRSSEEFCWEVEAQGAPLRADNGRTYRVRPVPDSALRPIRPGDISDEEVRDLYAPKLPEVA